MTVPPPGQLLGSVCRSLNTSLLTDLHLPSQGRQLSFHRQQAESVHSLYIHFTKQTKMRRPVSQSHCFCFSQLGRWTRFTAASCRWVTKIGRLICICWLLLTQIGHNLVTYTAETSHFPTSLLHLMTIFHSGMGFKRQAQEHRFVNIMFAYKLFA